MKPIDTLRRSLLAAACALPLMAAAADPFPSKPITIVVPYPAGGTTDVLARALQEPLQRYLKTTVIIDNRPGASAVLGAKLVAKAAPDGYTLLFPNNGLLISPYVSKDANYDPIKDFAPVSLVSLQPMVLVTNPVLAANNVRELIDYAKAHPGEMEFANAGPASFGQLATELFAKAAGIKVLNVPYKGQAPTTTALLTGEAKAVLSTTSSQMNAFIKDGKLKMLGTSSLTTSPLAPGAPPIADTLPGFNPMVWFALFAPAGTPPDVVARLNTAIVQTLAEARVRDQFELAGAGATGSTPAELGARIGEENGQWAKVIKEAGIKVD
ncbi:MAG: tripartite tricarboxylate transporter substrate binding protein [Rhizobacter sp.]|nr:tripartite tricarboxylate transporter substrate binding protein [Rhizobacter sp.]